MTDEAWVRGMGSLVLAFPDREQSREQAQARSQLYRTHLDDLTDQQWAHAVGEVIRSERWFPTVAALRAAAETWTPPAMLLMVPRRTPEEIAAGKEAARKGLALIRAEAEKRMGKLPDPVKRMSSDAPEPAA